MTHLRHPSDPEVDGFKSGEMVKLFARILQLADSLLGTSDLVIVARCDAVQPPMTHRRGTDSTALVAFASRSLERFVQACAVTPDSGESEPDARDPAGPGAPIYEPLGAGTAVALPVASEGGTPLGCIAMVLPKGANAAGPLAAVAQMAGLLLGTLRQKVDLELDLVSARKSISRLEKMASTDQLTGLLNAASFFERARQRCGGMDPAAGLIIVDVDHFKSINDVYGHQFGDSYLRTIADALTLACPDQALLGRIGGDEFAILLDLPARPQSYLEGVMMRCRTAVQRHTAMLGKRDLGRISAGAAICPDHASEFDTLFELADSALYFSKNTGRGAETVFSPGRHQRFNPIDLQRQFNEALRHDRIEPHFQPIHDLRSGLCTGYEVLARWRDPDHGLLLPAAFSGLFTDHRCAERLTRLIAGRAFEVMSQGPWAASSPCTVALNLTMLDLMNPELVFEFQSLMADAGHVDWSRIVIEVTESIMLGPRSGQIFRTLQELRLRGAKVALDDFGTGYGGLRHLSGWPVDILKVDRHFVSRLGEDLVDAAIVEAIIRIAAGSGLSIIAEGIETREQLRRLTSMSCERGQGFLFSPAVPRHEIAAASGQIDMAALAGDG